MYSSKVNKICCCPLYKRNYNYTTKCFQRVYHVASLNPNFTPQHATFLPQLFFQRLCWWFRLFTIKIYPSILCTYALSPHLHTAASKYPLRESTGHRYFIDSRTERVEFGTFKEKLSLEYSFVLIHIYDFLYTLFLWFCDRPPPPPPPSYYQYKIRTRVHEAAG